jgi:hypothetical protein
MVSPADIAEAEARGMGCLIASSRCLPSKDIKRLPCALDNGAFAAHKNGYPFDEYAFLRALNWCRLNVPRLEFIVIPDIVAGGWDSWNFSMSWKQRLQVFDRLAFVVQDGMRPNDAFSCNSMSSVSHIFIGGSLDWKWKTAPEWRKLATDLGKQLHIGRVGQADDLRHAEDIGADSVDSTSFVRNKTWHNATDYKARDLDLFSAGLNEPQGATLDPERTNSDE